MTVRTEILGVGFDDVTRAQAAATAMGRMREKRGGFAVTPNPEIVWLSRTDAELRRALAEASLVLADGVGVVYAARILGAPLSEKIPGIDFAQLLFELMAREHMSVFLLGAKPGVAEEAAERLRDRYPGLVIAGVRHGYFTEDEEVTAAVNAASPDLLLVCLGAPKQEKWMLNNAARLRVGFMAGLGGSLDVMAGRVRRAPEAWQRLGLEWLYRLIKEPWRVSRMKCLPLFMLKVIGQRLRKL